MTYWTRLRPVDQFETLTVKVGVFLLSLLGISTTLFRSSKHRTPLHTEYRPPVACFNAAQLSFDNILK
jgi:hypothetical protein